MKKPAFNKGDFVEVLIPCEVDLCPEMGAMLGAILRGSPIKAHRYIPAYVVWSSDKRVIIKDGDGFEHDVAVRDVKLIKGVS